MPYSDDLDEEQQTSLLSEEHGQALARSKRLLQETLRTTSNISANLARDGLIIGEARNKMTQVDNDSEDSTLILKR